jgi:hypothetical protein
VKRIAGNILLGLALAAVLVASGTAEDRQPNKPPALAVVAVLGPGEAAAQAGLATIAGVIHGVVEVGMPIGVFALGAGTTGRTLLYGRVADVDTATSLPPRPKAPGSNATSLAKRIYEAELAAWKTKTATACTTLKRTRKAKAADWARTHIGALLSSRARSHAPITDADVAVIMLRAETFFRREGGTPLLAVIGDVPDTPPSTDGIDFGMSGAHVVLAGWTPSEPQAFRIKISRWKGFFNSLGAAAVHVLPRGIDTTPNIVSSLRISRAC